MTNLADVAVNKHFVDLNLTVVAVVVVVEREPAVVAVAVNTNFDWDTRWAVDVDEHAVNYDVDDEMVAAESFD